ncbi:LytR C-terminal domain-containing protein [Blastococcus sp. PRF04-17]|uniref:LytR C-terminal domain-containing protein n=1 Tax=Blastococcus sp. PRF04-17 TaxID=2933797 RepID=UPI001FF42190|nr:LytR C-terminal domain-containing protein [Blastococcus sp. PRF04-17]UOX99876.1 LytR C-terminal domain-containing protein [Blastococcus sp. PRF04-17]
MLKGLIAMTVVALGVLGVYTVVSPETEQVSAQTPAGGDASSRSVAPPSEPLPELEVAPLEVAEPTAVAPIRLPVTVLNSTDINGLAAKIAGAVTAGGWESPGVGAYTGGDIAASTVFFTEGDENQRQAALQLIEQFPQLQGPAPRFFELPAEVPAPGLVVVATGDWQP